MKTEPAEKRDPETDLEGALSLLLLGISILILLVKLIYAAFFDSSGLSGIPFLAPLSDSKIQAITADWVVYITVLTHVVRIKFGIAFLKYDTSYLAAGERLGFSGHDRKVRAIFILANAALATLVAAFLTAKYPSLLIIAMLLVQSVVILWYDWKTRRQLFTEDTDRKANFLIVAGDLAFFAFCLAAALFHFSYQSDGAFGGFMLGYFCLIAFAAFELLTLVLVVEFFFTYREGLRQAWKTFKQAFDTGEFNDGEQDAAEQPATAGESK